jgi:hypothetical protein
VNLDEILYGGDDIEYYLDYILIYPVALTIPKWRKFKLLRWVILFIQLVDLDEILYEDDDIKDNLDSIIINPVASAIPKWLAFKLLWWLQVLN